MPDDQLVSDWQKYHAITGEPISAAILIAIAHLEGKKLHTVVEQLIEVALKKKWLVEYHHAHESRWR